jgi:hypothetical protein
MNLAKTACQNKMLNFCPEAGEKFKSVSASAISKCKGKRRQRKEATCKAVTNVDYTGLTRDSMSGPPSGYFTKSCAIV